MKKGKLHSYTLDFKQSSAKLASESDQPVSQIAKELGINVNTLHTWINKYGNNATVMPATSDIHEELKRLKKENARLKQERDILKKAAAYFASETQ
jgi:transposase